MSLAPSCDTNTIALHPLKRNDSFIYQMATPDFPILNCTPHPITIFTSDDLEHPLYCLPAVQDGSIRLATRDMTHRGTFHGIPVVNPQSFTGLQSPLPVDLESATAIIVSWPVAEWAQANRPSEFAGKRIFIPDTSEEGAVRTCGGFIIGVKRLVEYSW